jgi:hypothetical protein
MNGKLFQHIHPIHAFPAAVVAACEDFFDGDPASDVIALKKYGAALFLIVKNAGATGTSTITVESCDDVTPSTATAIAFNYWECTTPDVWSDMKTATASGFATTAGADQMYAIEIHADALSTTDAFVRLQTTELVDSPVDGMMTAIAGDARYLCEVKPTALA